MNVHEYQAKELMRKFGIKVLNGHVAKSADEAKTIYETLQSTVQGNNKVNAPKSLSEAITRSSSTVFQTKQNDTTTPEVERMRRLAGIK